MNVVNGMQQCVVMHAGWQPHTSLLQLVTSQRLAPFGLQQLSEHLSSFMVRWNRDPAVGAECTVANCFSAAGDLISAAPAGTYGVLTLFGIMPAAMAWRQRYNNNGQSEGQHEVVPGGKLVLLCIGGAAAGVIGNELALLLLE